MLLPTSFDKIFHPTPATKRNTSMGPNQLANIAKKMGFGNKKETKGRSHSFENDERVKKGQISPSREMDEELKEAFQAVSDGNEEDFAKEDLDDDKHTFYEAKQVFLRRMENSSRRRSANSKINRQAKESSKVEIIKELQ